MSPGFILQTNNILRKKIFIGLRAARGYWLIMVKYTMCITFLKTKGKGSIGFRFRQRLSASRVFFAD